MSVLAPWRRELRRLLPRGFLRRDRGNGLFVSDFPRWDDAGERAEALRQAGYAVEIEGEIARISVTKGKLRRLLDASPLPEIAPTDETLPLYSLARRFLRAGGLEAWPINSYSTLLKCLDAGDWAGADAWLRPRAAEWQRSGRALPGDVGRAILLALDRRKGAKTAC